MASMHEAEYLSAVQSGDFSRLLAPKRKLLERLRSNPKLRGGDPSEALAEITESTARMIDVARVGLWRFDAERDHIVCLDIYIVPEHRHERGTVLPKQVAPAYFAAVSTGLVIAAEDAYKDPRTSEFGQQYLPANGIGAMLDTPVLIHGHLAGVLCHEHLGGPRRWMAWERTLAASLSECAGVILGDVAKDWMPT